MKSEILEILTQSFGEERLDKIKKFDESYQTAFQEEVEAHDNLEETLSKEQKSLLDNFVFTTSKKAAILEKIHYRQGMKDLFNLYQMLVSKE